MHVERNPAQGPGKALHLEFFVWQVFLHSAEFLFFFPVGFTDQTGWTSATINAAV